jgi:hypothetical protein
VIGFARRGAAISRRPGSSSRQGVDGGQAATFAKLWRRKSEETGTPIGTFSPAIGLAGQQSDGSD